MDTDDQHLASRLVETASGRLSAGQMLAGRYQVERELGRGAMGLVYIARDLQLLAADSTRVVIKLLNAEALSNLYIKRKFFQEFESLTRVRHPNVVMVLGRGELPDSAPFFVMEFVDGESLRAAIPPQGMDLARVAAIVRQIGSGLTAVHERGVLHCDLKPSNIMLQAVDGADEVVKLIDFGVAKVRDSLVSSAGLATQVMGTLDYASPEHFSATLSVPSDIYCFGLIAYEMVTGRRPFNPETDAQLPMLQSLGVQVKPCSLRPALPKAAQDAILKALALDPTSRFQRAWEFGDTLARTLTVPRAINLTSPVSEPTVQEPAEPTLQMAYILALEIVGAAKRPVDQQVETMRKLNDIVCATKPFRSAVVAKELVSLPSGDGMVLAFFSDPTAPIRCAQELTELANNCAGLTMRMGVHSAPVYRNYDSSGSVSITGGGISVAKLIMERGEVGHILVSASVADVLSQISQWTLNLTDLGDCILRDGSKSHLYNFCIGAIGNPKALVATVRRGAAGSVEKPTKTRTGGLDRFDDRARHVMAEAVDLARKNHWSEVTTLHLFAAMMARCPSQVRHALEHRGIPPERLQTVIADVLARKGRPSAASADSASIGMSDNLQHVFRNAAHAASAAGLERIDEVVLLSSLLAQPESSVRSILEMAGLKVADLDIDQSHAPGNGPRRIGDLSERDCVSDSWASLLRACSAAASDGRDFLTSTDLLAGPLAAALRSLGIRGPVVDPGCVPRGGEIACSKNTSEILRRAKSAAAPALVSVAHLVEAFIEHSGGAASKVIRAEGIEPEWLATEIFSEGRIDLKRFSSRGRAALEIAIELARKRSDPLLSSEHLLYGLTSLDGGCLSVRLRALGKDAGHLARLLRANLPPTKPSRRGFEPDLARFEKELLTVLCRAEHMAGQSKLDDEHLLQAAASAGGRGSDFLARRGVSLQDLARQTSDRPNPSAG